MAIQTVPPKRPTFREKSSLQTTLFFEAFSLLAVTVLLMGLTTFFLARHELMARTISGLESAAYARENMLESTISEQRRQLSILAKDPTLLRLPSITGLVGFRSLFVIDNNGQRTFLAGEKNTVSIDALMLQKILETPYTSFLPIVDTLGWNSSLITAPRMDTNGVRTGTYIAVFDTKNIVSRLFETATMDASSEVLLATIQDGTLTVLHTDEQGGAVPIQTSSENQSLLVQRALAVKQGTEETIDYAGIPVLSVYRTMPSIGWTVIVQMDRAVSVQPILRLAINVVGIGLMLICLLSLSMFALSKRITEPLTALVRKLNGLETVHWHFERSIFTGNELESVDSAAQELTGRLRESYDHLEGLVEKRTEALRKENARNTAILENIEDGLLMTNKRGDVVFANRAAELLTGMGAGELFGKHSAEALPIVDRRNVPIPQNAHPITQVLGTKKSFHPIIDPEFSLVRKNEVLTPIHLRATPIMKGEECLGSIVILRDATEERHIDRVKSEFITLVSHQLRTPLSSIRWYLEMLLDTNAPTPFTTEQHECIDEISVSNARMTNLVNALLNVSRLELEKPETKTEAVSLNSLLAEITDSFKLELRQRKMNITIDADTQHLLNPETDRTLLRLIIENLMSNAIKYGKEGTNLSIKLGTDTTSKRATIAITDRGIGVPDSEKKQIFQKMYRCTNAKTTDTDGNGLGLYISRIAADSIGATIVMESAEGKGSTFTVSVPMKREKK